MGVSTIIETLIINAIDIINKKKTRNLFKILSFKLTKFIKTKCKKKIIKEKSKVKKFILVRTSSSSRVLRKNKISLKLVFWTASNESVPKNSK